MNTSQTTLTARPAAGVQGRTERRDRAIWLFVGALVLLFWVPDLILYMEWADFWILFLTEVFIWALFAVAFNLLMGYTGLVSFGQAAFLGIGGYTTGLLLKKISGFPFALGLIAAPLGGALAAVIIGYFCVRLSHIYFAMLTLAFGQIVYFAAFKWYDFTGGDNGLIGVPVPAWVQDPTFSNYYKFVLIICVCAVYLIWRIVNSPFGKTLTAIRENPERASFVGIDVKRYQLYAFIIAGAFSGLAGALITINERSVYPDLAFWTQSAQVLLMSILGGVYTFFGPIVGALLLLIMDADITQDYPEIWQLFLGGVLVLILYALPGGIMGFIQARDMASTDDEATRQRKLLDEFRRKFWYFFCATLFFTGFFSILQDPEAWLAVILRTLLQAAVGIAVFPWMFGRLVALSRGMYVAFLIFPLVPLVLYIALGTPLSGLVIAALWGVFIYNYLLQGELRRAFSRRARVDLQPVTGA